MIDLSQFRHAFEQLAGAARPALRVFRCERQTIAAGMLCAQRLTLGDRALIPCVRPHHATDRHDRLVIPLVSYRIQSKYGLVVFR